MPEQAAPRPGSWLKTPGPADVPVETEPAARPSAPRAPAPGHAAPKPGSWLPSPPTSPSASTPPGPDAQVPAPPVPAAPPPGQGTSEERSLAELRAALRTAQRRERELAGEVLSLHAERELDRERMREQEEAIDALERRADQLRKKYRDASSRLSRLEKSALAGRETDGPAFLDPQRQWRHETYLAWCRRIPPSDKQRLPLPESYIIGPEFLDSLAAVQGVSRMKVTDVVVEVLTGLVNDLGGREVHTLRAGEGGRDPVVRRADGAVCWRAALQRGTPAARRLHFWRLPDGTVELARVVTHDDFRP